MVKDLGIIECIGEGWEKYKPYLILGSVGQLLWMAIHIAGTYTPYVKYIYSFFISPAMIGGLCLFYLNIALNRDPRINDLFAGFRRYGAMQGIFWLTILIGVVILFPSLVIFFLVTGMKTHPLWVQVITILFFLFLLFVCLIRYSMVFFVLMENENMGVFESLQRSSDLVRGNGHNLVLLFIMTTLIGLGALILFILPVFIAGPALGTAHAVAYLKLKQFRSEIYTPVPVNPAPSETI